MKSKRTSVVATALTVAVVGGGFAVAREIQNSVIPAAAHADETRAPSRASLPAFADLAERVSPAVVNIKVTAVAKTDFPDAVFRRRVSVSRFSQIYSPATP